MECFGKFLALWTQQWWGFYFFENKLAYIFEDFEICKLRLPITKMFWHNLKTNHIHKNGLAFIIIVLVISLLYVLNFDLSSTSECFAVTRQILCPKPDSCWITWTWTVCTMLSCITWMLLSISSVEPICVFNLHLLALFWYWWKKAHYFDNHHCECCTQTLHEYRSEAITFN